MELPVGAEDNHVTTWLENAPGLTPQLDTESDASGVPFSRHHGVFIWRICDYTIDAVVWKCLDQGQAIAVYNLGPESQIDFGHLINSSCPGNGFTKLPTPILRSSRSLALRSASCRLNCFLAQATR